MLDVPRKMKRHHKNVPSGFGERAQSGTHLYTMRTHVWTLSMHVNSSRDGTDLQSECWEVPTGGSLELTVQPD